MSDIKMASPRKSPGPSLKYVDFLKCLDNDVIYTISAIVQNGIKHGLISEEEEEGQQVIRARTAIQRFIKRNLNAEYDGNSTYPNCHTRQGWYGWRLKGIIPPSYLTPEEYAAIQQRIMKEGPYGEMADALRHPLQVGRSTIAAILGLCLALVLVVVFIMDLGSSSHLEQRLSDYRLKLSNPKYRQDWYNLRREIAQIQTRLNQSVPIIEDITDVEAVFATDVNPSVMFTDWQPIRGGDLITIAGIHGYLGDVTRTRIVLETKEGPFTFELPPLSVFGYTGFKAFPINIYSKDANLDQLLLSLSKITNRSLEGNPEVYGVVFGKFEELSYDDFLQTIAPGTGIKITERTIEVEATRSVRSHIGFTSKFTQRKKGKISQILAEYGDHMGFEVNFVEPFSSQYQDPEIRMAGTQFAKLCEDFSLEMQVELQTRVIEVFRQNASIRE